MQDKNNEIYSQRGDSMSKPVVLYSTPTCPWCVKAKEYLQSKGVDVAEYNVAQDPDKYSEMVSASGQTGVPVIQVGNNVVVGFNKTRLDELLEQ